MHIKDESFDIKTYKQSNEIDDDSNVSSSIVPKIEPIDVNSNSGNYIYVRKMADVVEKIDFFSHLRSNNKEASSNIKKYDDMYISMVGKILKIDKENNSKLLTYKLIEYFKNVHNHDFIISDKEFNKMKVNIQKQIIQDLEQILNKHQSV